MGRRVNNVPVSLPEENTEIETEKENEIIEPSDNQDNEVEQGLNENEEINNLSDEEKVETELKPGDKVKLGDIKNDTMGRRIHAGIKNYVYTIKNIRPDNVACIECLTHIFYVKTSDLIKQ